MSRSEDAPERLLAGDATDFERRLLEGELRKGPAAASSARLARALGVTLTATGTLPAKPAVAAKPAAAAPAAATALPWMPVAALGLVLAAAAAGVHAWRGARAPAGADPVSAPRPAAPAPSVSNPGSQSVGPTFAAQAVAGDLGEQIALLDGARSALAQGNAGRALKILQRYHDKYPSGSFQPEASAVKVEALLKLGQEAEARALAAQFVAQHRGSLLARKVADLAGLDRQPSVP